MAPSSAGVAAAAATVVAGGARRTRHQRRAQLTRLSWRGLPAVNTYGPGASRLAAAEAVATSADEEVVCEGEKTREERDAELRGEAVLLDE